MHDFLKKAHEMRDYFEGLDHQFPNQIWHVGLQASRRWIDYLEQGADQEEIERFTAYLYAERFYHGCGWLDLFYEVRNWLYAHSPHSLEASSPSSGSDSLNCET